MKKLIPLFLLLSVASYLGAQSIPNGDFENFGEDTFEQFDLIGGMFNVYTCQIDGGTLESSGNFTGNDRPVGFRTTDDFVANESPFYATATTDAQAGTTALSLIGDGAFAFGIAGIFRVETLVQRALPVDFPFTQLPTAINGFYKHTSGTPVTFPAGACTDDGPLDETTIFEGGFAVYAQFFDAMGNVIAEIDEVYPDAQNFTAFSAPVEVLSPNVVPTQLVLVFSSCPEFISPNPILIPGSETIIDEVDFEYAPVSTSPILLQKGWSLYPNPAQQIAYLESEQVFGTEFQIFNATGQLVEEGLLEGKVHAIDLSHYPEGIYFVKSNGTVQRLIVQD